jgi:chloramphenicol-sensitive protein RarD
MVVSLCLLFLELQECVLNRGILYGAVAYLLWGFFPIYFKALHQVPALEIMFHRVIWSFILLALLVWARKEWAAFRSSIARPKTILLFTVVAIFLAVNWLIYIYGVNAGQVLETSLGYYISPLASVALGMVFLRERLRPMQWVPVLMAAAAVLYLTWQYGALPWIALALAFTFSMYGLMKKVAPLGSLYGLTLETAILLLPAIVYLLIIEGQGKASFLHAGAGTSALLAFTGVITALPLLLFGSAARQIPLTMIGLLQYIAPTVQFFLGVLVYHEPFDSTRLVGFSIIWAALVIFWLENWWQTTRVTRAKTAIDFS